LSSFRVVLLGLAHPHVSDHLAVIEADPGLHVSAIWDPAADRLTAVPSLSPLVAGDPVAAASGADIIVIDSVTGAHGDLVRVAAAAGKAGFVEKPLGRTGAQAHELAAR